MRIPHRLSPPAFADDSRTLKGFIILCQLFGASPIIVSKSWKCIRLRHLQRFITVVHLLWTTFILTIIALSMCKMYLIYPDQKFAKINKILTISEYSLNLMNCVIIVIGTNYQRQWRDIYFRHINGIDDKLQFAARESNAHLNRFLWIICMISMAILVPVMTIMFYYHNGDYYGLSITYIAYIVSNLVITLGLVQFIVMLFIVKIRYRRLASALGGLSWSSPLSQRPPKTNGIPNIFFLGIQPISSSEGMHSPPNQWSTIQHKIEVLRTCYVELNILEQSISESFGFFIVGLVTSKCIVVTSQLYLFYTLTQGYIEVLVLAYSGLWLLLHFANIFFLLYLSSEVVVEVNQGSDWLYVKIIYFIYFRNVILLEFCIKYDLAATTTKQIKLPPSLIFLCKSCMKIRIRQRVAF